MPKKRVAELAQDERHHTVAETRYWCQQYRIMAEQLERERDEARHARNKAILELEAARAQTQRDTRTIEQLTQAWSLACDERDRLRALLQEWLNTTPEHDWATLIDRTRAALEGRDG